MLAKGQTVIQHMEQLAPKSAAEPDDRIGLQLGSLNKEISHVLIALDVTEEVVDEAVAAGVDLIIAHHAIIYRPLKGLQTDTPMGRIYEKLIKHDIAVYISHTNLDITEGGMNDWMAEALGIQNPVSIHEVHTETLYKLVTFVPKSHHQEVLDAVLNAGAGHLGQYSHCSFNTEGFGTFMPLADSSPFIGAPGKLERVDEVRVETIVPDGIRKKVVQALLKHHPYEEVAYDLYPLELKGRTLGLGRTGKLRQEMTLEDFAEVVKQQLDVPHVRVVGKPGRVIRKAAVIGGSGGKFMHAAMFKGADVLVTGDVDYHTALDALAAGLCLIDPGHNAEKIMKEKVALWLSEKLKQQGAATKVTASRINTEPFRFM
ncbi:Nif3-like dinuclear metal center hexameric protein [Paenibacillus sp. JSM ZJ436]|uniref:Nif3-like dinuclear metal center hexameric protein n=1 Tax=Paenibacillus sp. JSM ZJ436 TaxID=3376190 RepID=UPI0037B800B3